MNREYRGVASEALVEQAIQVIRRKSDDKLPRIQSYMHAYPNSGLDRRGIDFLVRFENGLEIPLQVKSSTRGKRKFERAHRSGPFIPVVIASIDEEIGIIINRVIQCMRLAINRVMRQVEKQRSMLQRRIRSIKNRDQCNRYFAARMCH
ncbi:MAG: hypothetical protein WCK03_03135 [Candidatus Taylorbacteria bacterium]